MNILEKHAKNFGVLGMTLGVAALTVIGLRFTVNPSPTIPLPFGFSESSSLAGSVSEIGIKNGISVKKVAFPAGTDSETLAMDTLYLVTVPDDVMITESALDDAFSIGASHDINYFGYKYSSASAATEITNRDAATLLQRFPGQFFASAKARAEDPNHGNAIANFESANGITMAATNTATGAKLTRNSLYFVIVNESSPVAMTVRMPPALHLQVVGKSTATTDTTVKNAKNVLLQRFELRAQNGDILFTEGIFRAAQGDLINAYNYTLRVDTDDNGIVDTTLQSGVSPQGNEIRFSLLAGGGYVIPSDTSVVFEVWADVASSFVQGSPVLQLKFSTTSSFYIGAETVADGRDLTGIRTDGVCSSGCDITVTTAPSTLYTLRSQGDLYVTKSSTPVRSRQLLGGVLGDEILRLQLHAEYEDIDVTDLVFTADAPDEATFSSNVDRLELYRVGETTPFATATVGGCGSDAVPTNSMCAKMLNQELVVPKGSNTNILVRPRMRTDTNGAVSGKHVKLRVDAIAGAKARGLLSSNNLVQNNGDAAPTGEVFIGTSSAAPSQTMTGNDNVVVLSKIISITNASPDQDGTSIPSGTERAIGQFKFTTAAASNLKNGINKWKLTDVIFTVDANNVRFDETSFKFYNKADTSQKFDCYTLDSDSTLPKFFVACWDIQNVDTEISPDADATFVLQANILDTQISSSAVSSLQVSLTDFSDAAVSGMAANLNHVSWLDKDNGSSERFFWIEYPDTAVRSTLYGPPPPPVCGNGQREGSEACDDNDTDSGDGCSASCAVESGYTCSGSPSVCTQISSTPLAITVLPLPATANANASSRNLALIRFRATAGPDPVLFKSAMFGATTGNLSSLTNYSLWRDTNGDGVADTKVLDQHANNSTETILVFFDAAVAQNRVIQMGQSAIFEVRGDVRFDSDLPASIQLGLKTDLANFFSGLNQRSDQHLSGIKTDGLCLFTCEIDVTTMPSTLFHIAAP